MGSLTVPIRRRWLPGVGRLSVATWHPRYLRRRGAVLWPLLAILALLASVLVLVAFVGSPRQVRQCGAVIDHVIINTVDELLGCDTLTMPGLRPEDFPAFVLFEPLLSSYGIVSEPPSRPPPLRSSTSGSHPR